MKEIFTLDKLQKSQKIILIFVLFFFYFYYFASSSGRNGSNDGGHLALASAMYYDHELSVEKYMGTYLSKPDYAVKDGVIYSDRLPGNAFSIIPFLFYSDLIKPVLPKKTQEKSDYNFISATLFPNICGVLGLYLLFVLSFKVFLFDYTKSLILLIIAGLATLNQMESTHLYSHAPSMVLITLAVTIALLIKDKSEWKKELYIISGIIGFSTIVELQNILFLAPIYAYVVFQHKAHLDIKKLINPTLISIGIVSFFVGILVFYNYITFGEIFLKSNKYNPFFEEEKSFLTALSGNFFDGFDNLFTSFKNLKSNIDWSLAVNNGTPGILAANPVFIFSVTGFFFFYKKHKLESILFLTIISIAVLIAAFHVTTLVRHMFTIHMLLFFPFVFFMQWVSEQPKKKAFIWHFLLTATFFLSFTKEVYLNNHYWGRNYGFFHFEYFKNIDLFIFLNIPIILLLLIRFMLKKNSPKTDDLF